MPSTIPFDPSLVLGNIADPGKIAALEAVAEAKRPIDLAQDDLNSLIATERSLAITLQELINMQVDSKDLSKFTTQINKVKSDYIFNHTMIANKSKWIGPDVEFHQEIFNLNTFAPGANPKKDWKKIMQIYIAIDNQKSDSGSLRIIPSSHKLGQLKHEDCVNSFLNHKRRVVLEDLNKAYNKYGLLNMSLKSGDLLIFNTRLLHGSPSNASNDDRMAIVSQVRSSKIKLNKKIFNKETNYRQKVVENYLLKKISNLKKVNNYNDFRKQK